MFTSGLVHHNSVLFKTFIGPLYPNVSRYLAASEYLMVFFFIQLNLCSRLALPLLKWNVIIIILVGFWSNKFNALFCYTCNQRLILIIITVTRSLLLLPHITTLWTQINIYRASLDAYDQSFDWNHSRHSTNTIIELKRYENWFCVFKSLFDLPSLIFINHKLCHCL